MIYTTTRRTEYIVSRKDRLAYPKLGPALFPADLWDADCAAASGQLVEAGIPRSDYRVRSAGSDWLEVWEYLQGL